MTGDTRWTLARHDAPSLFIGPLAALCLAVPLLAGAGERLDDKSEAASVAKKVDKAVATAHQAEEERDALRHFQDELAEYADLHATLLAKLGGKESVATQKALAHALQAKRVKAKPGDVFGPDVQPVFRRLIAEQLQGPGAIDARRTLFEGDDPEEPASVPVVVRVNAEYPPGAPRSTVPPSVLLTLPTLPECLHYRFVDRDLILVDSVAQLIVDFLPAAAPEIAVK